MRYNEPADTAQPRNAAPQSPKFPVERKSMNVPHFQGVIVPIVTPLTPDERVDTASLRRLVDYLIDSGVHGIWAAGTNGEFAALRDEQRILAIETIVEAADSRVPVIGNVSAPATAATIDLARSLAGSKLDGIAATPPYYYHYDQAELSNHFRAVSAASKHPLWIYNFPAMTKLTVEPATIADLAADGAVVGVKDSSGAGEALAELVTLCDLRGIELYRFLGSVYRAPAAKRVGAHGVIPGIGNLAASALSKAWEAGEANDDSNASKHLRAAIEAQQVTWIAQAGGRNAASASAIKASLKIMGIIDHDYVTSPMRPLTNEEKAQIPPILRRAGLMN